MPSPPTQSRQVRVFISSTFRDMHAERDHLVTVVFPELRERVEQLGLEFFDVDLRWGVPARAANGETANSWEYCRQWIERVEPFFVGILGQRYGWVPEPEKLKDPVAQKAQRDHPRSITDMEVRHAVLGSQLKRRSYFYLRHTPVPVPAPDATEEQLETYSEFVDPQPLADKLEQLKAEVRIRGRPVRDYECRWTGKEFADLDKVEQQFGPRVLEDLWSGVLRDERYVSKDVWRQAMGGDPDDDPRYTNEGVPVPDDLAAKIIALAKPPPKDPLEAERQQMEAFATTRLRWFQGRTAELEALTRFITSTDPDSPRLAVVAALPGQGKSALLARLSTLLNQPSTFLITHFVGATERSASVHALVQRLLDELDRSGIPWPVEPQEEGREPKRDFHSLCLRLAQRLGDYAGERRIVLLLNALNQLSDGHDLNWLPQRLGAGVRVVASCIDDPAAKSGGPEQKVWRALDARHPAPLRVPLGPLTETDVRTVTEEYLHEYCHELDREHLDALCAIPQARNPLYLLVMLNELRTLGGNDLNRLVPARIASMLQDHPDTVSLFRWVLQRLEVFNEHAPDAVRWWCLYLAHGRVGMASHELADLLARKLGPGATATALRIERGLRRYLQRRGPQLDFFHGQLRQAVFEQYDPQAEATAVHADIATYFRDQADPENKQLWRQNARLLRELPFHLARGGRNAELCELFSQLAFLSARVATNQVYEQVADYVLADSPLPSALGPWRDFLQKHSQRLRQHPAMLVALVNHEGFPEARAQVPGVAWPHSWLRTSPEPMPAAEVDSAQDLHIQVARHIQFHWNRVSTIAQQRSVAFCLERLGVIRVFDLTAMRETEATLSIQRTRPLVLACAPDATSLAIFYESGRAELYQCAFGQYDWPTSLNFVVAFDFHLPESEDPVVTWHQGAFWYQATAGVLASISCDSPRALEEALPISHHGELAALVFSDELRLAALRQGSDTILLASGAPPQRRPGAHVSSACACGQRRVAAAFTDGVIVVFEMGDTLAVKAELRAGLLRGALGWDGSRLLWMGASSGFRAWRPEELSPLSVQENQEAFPATLYVLPRCWLVQSDGSVLLGTSHNFVVFRILEGGAARDGRLEEIFGGSTWRAVRKREKEQWLLEKQRSHEILLEREVMGRLYCAPDGQGRFFAASGYGPGLVVDLSTLRSAPLQHCPPGVNAAVGEDKGGCWLTDRTGSIYFVDATGQCNGAARITLPGIHGSRLENAGDYLIWAGYSTKSFEETGADAARTFVFFKKIPGNPPMLQQLGEQIRHPREGVCVAICYDQVAERLVTLWVNAKSSGQCYSLRVGPLEDFARWQFQEFEVNGLGEFTFIQAALSANGRFLGIVNMHGEISCLCVASGQVCATLANSAPFTAVAPGGDGSEFWLTEARANIYKCALVEGSA